QKTTPEALARAEHQEQLARNATCQNAITSLRDIAFFDWPAFVEELSLVDRILQDAFDFKALSFPTRDRYRHAVENLARGSRYSQLEIARFVAKHVAAARAQSGLDTPQADAGDCLIGPGSRAFERQIKYVPPLARRLGRAATASGAPLYFGSLALLCVLGLSVPFSSAMIAGLPPALVLGMALLALVPASEIAVALVNHAVMKSWPPSQLPALALKGGVPVELRTMVVMPVILGDAGGFHELLELLEIHYLANPDGELFFGLLTDWPDAAAEELPGEAALLRAAQEGVAALNRLHGPGPGNEPRFGLHHRARRFNAQDGVWMGWERKRGKLHEFNRLLRGQAGTSYAGLAAAPPPKGVRYVITLDRDTLLPRGAAARLVGTLAHPLNKARLNAKGDQVMRGYGILQPRIS
ncbi:MAG TPA: hypothetical protein VNZ67_01375, partial [bacterium]|nr:hypothetical protein [bacterium]